MEQCGIWGHLKAPNLKMHKRIALVRHLYLNMLHHWNLQKPTLMPLSEDHAAQRG